MAPLGWHAGKWLSHLQLLVYKKKKKKYLGKYFNINIYFIFYSVSPIGETIYIDFFFFFNNGREKEKKKKKKLRTILSNIYWAVLNLLAYGDVWEGDLERCIRLSRSLLMFWRKKEKKCSRFFPLSTIDYEASSFLKQVRNYLHQQC